MKAVKCILAIAAFSAFVACNMRNADNPSNSAPSSSEDTMPAPDMTTGGEPVTHQPLDSILRDSTGTDTMTR